MVGQSGEDTKVTMVVQLEGVGMYPFLVEPKVFDLFPINNFRIRVRIVALI